MIMIPVTSNTKRLNGTSYMPIPKMGCQNEGLKVLYLTLIINGSDIMLGF